MRYITKTPKTKVMKNYEITFEGFLRYGSGVLWDIFNELNTLKEKHDLSLFITSVFSVNDGNDKDVVLTLVNATEDKLDIVINYLTNQSQEHYEKYGDFTPFLVIDNVRVTTIK
jgi:hypothetical protein